MISKGMESRETSVLNEIRFTEQAVSFSYFTENMVVMAAVGALIEMTRETNIVPRTCKR